MKLISITSLSILVYLASCSSPESGQQAETFDSLRYSIVIGDNEAGSQVSWKEGSDYRFQYEFNDRGRGPVYDETIRLDGEGFIEYLSITGVNYFKDSINESFKVTEGQAVWKNVAEDGYQPFDENKGFYYSADGSLGGFELMVRKMLETPDKKVNLVPAGTAEVATINRHTFGDTLQLDMLTITGLGFTPFYVWMDQDSRMMASVSGWFNMIQEGYEPLKDELIKIQNKSENQFFNDQAEKLTKVPAKGLYVSNVNVIDTKSGKFLPDQVVVVEGNTISYSGPSSGAPENNGLDEIDGKGMTLMPGLFDMHGHFSKQDGILDIAAGVTSARDLANDTTVVSLKRDFDSNRIIGPRMLTLCGFIDGAGPYAGPTGKIINNVEEGIEAIDFYHDLGYQQIKLYSSIKPEWVKPLVDHAHEQGMKVSGHIPAYMTASQAVESGYDEIQHINMVILNFLPDTIDTRTPLRFSMVAEYATDVDTESKEYKDFIGQLKREKIVIDPTVAIFEGMFKSLKKTPSPMFEMIIDRLPVTVRSGFYSGGLPKPEDKVQLYADSHDKMLEIIESLWKEGVTIVPGTDALPGFTLHRELELYAKAGIPNSEVLRIATIKSAQVVGMDNQLGSIDAGKLADFILVEGNPMNDISDIRKVDLVVKNGNVYDPASLYKSVGVSHYK